MKEIVLPDKSKINVADISEISPLIENQEKKIIGFTIITNDGKVKNVMYKLHSNYQKSREKVELNFTEIKSFWTKLKTSNM